MEIKDLLTKEEIYVIFLTESDTNILCESNYKIPGFITVFHKRECNTEKVRIVALFKEKFQSQIIIMRLQLHLTVML